jgi:DNA-binding NarL/FixJ family response regulator
MTRLLLYSKEPLLAKGLESVLRQAGGFELLPLCSTLAELREELAHQTPGLVLLDHGPELTFAVLSEMQRATSSKIVLWVNSISIEMACQAMGLGIRGILRKTLPPQLQVNCLRQVQGGEMWCERSLVDDFISARHVALTPREGQLMTLLTQGLNNKEIALHLMVSEGTVRVSLSRLYQKAGVKDRFELALIGLKNLSFEASKTGVGSTTCPRSLVIGNSARPVGAAAHLSEPAVSAAM